MAVIFSSALGDVVVVVATCVVVGYVYLARGFRYWEKRGIPFIKPTSIFGNMGRVALQREHVSEFFKRVYDSNPGQPVVGLFGGRKPILTVRDLDILRYILVKDAHAFLDKSADIPENDGSLFARSLFMLKGKRWRHMRIKLTPTFTSGKVKKMFYLINECGKQLVPCIDREMKEGKCMVKDTVARYSTDVIASCAFGMNANALEDPNCEFRATMRKMFELNGFQRFISLIIVLVPWLLQLIGFKFIEYKISPFIRKTFWGVVDYRKKNNIVRKDFVDILMQLKDEGQVQADDENDLDEIKQDSKYVNMHRSDKEDIKLEDDDFVAQAFIFILAGYETSSSVISFTLYELARIPTIQDKLRKEIKAVLDKHNSEVTYDSINEMSYLDMVVSESMRKYPTLPLLDRKCLSDYRIPGTDITIEKGVTIGIPVLGIHMDPAIYPEPDKFDPERFSPENKSKRPHFAYLPFGEGPRMCIGMRFGQMQVKTALIHILTSFKVNTCADTPQPPLGMVTAIGVNIPKKDIILSFEKIK